MKWSKKYNIFLSKLVEWKYQVWEIKNTQVKCKYVWMWCPQLWVWFAHTWLTVFLANMSKQTLNCHNILFENTKWCWVNKSMWHHLFLSDRTQLKWWEWWCCTSPDAEWSNSFCLLKKYCTVREYVTGTELRNPESSTDELSRGENWMLFTETFLTCTRFLL